MGGLLSTTYDPILYHACKSGDKDKVKRLLNEGAAKHINYYSSDGDTPLHNVCRHGWLDMVKVFVETLDCNVWTEDYHGITPVHIVFKYAHLSIIEYFINRCGIMTIVQKLNDKIVSERGLAMIQWLNGHWHMLKQMHAAEALATIRYNHCPTSDGSTVLHLACMVDNNPHILYHLLQDDTINLNVTNNNGMTPLHIACKSKRPDIVQVLSHNANCDINFVDNYGDTSLLTACRCSQFDCVKVLLFDAKCKPDVVNKDGDTALHIACKENSVDIIAAILLLQIDVNAKNSEGDTPLHISCRKQALDTVKLLVDEHGCNVNIKNHNLEAPLHIACEIKSHDMVKILLKNNMSGTSGEPCDPNTKNKFGNTALHIACEKCSFLITNSILSHPGCDPNISNNDGKLPLHIACAAGQYSTVHSLLLDSHCDVNAKTSDGDTALEIAIKGNQIPTVNLLLSCQKFNLSDTDSNVNSFMQITSNINIIKALVKHGIRLNANDVFQLLTKSQRTRKVIKVLKLCMTNSNLQWKPDDRTTNGDTALHVASRLSVDFVDFLIMEARCDPSATNEDGDTPLHIACGTDNGDIVALEPKKIDITPSNAISMILIIRDCDFLSQEDMAGVVFLLPLVKLGYEWMFGKSDNGEYSDSDIDEYGDASSHKSQVSIHELSDEMNEVLSDDDFKDYFAHSTKSTDDLKMHELNEGLSGKVWNDKSQSPNKSNDKTSDEDDLESLIRSEFVNSDHSNKSTEDKAVFDPEKVSSTAEQCTHCQSDNQEKNDEQAPDTLSIGSSERKQYSSDKSGDKTSTDDELHSEISSTTSSESDSSASISTEDEDIPLLLQIYSDFQNKLMDGKKTFYWEGSKDIDKSMLLHFSFYSNAIKYLVQTPEIVQHLVSKFEGGLHVRNKSGETPLHIACKAARPLNVLYLLSNTDCDITATNGDGDMPLHVACKASRALTVHLLLSIAKCDPNSKSGEGKTPIELTSNPIIIFELFDHGAKATSDNVFKTLNKESSDIYEYEEYKSKLLKFLKCMLANNTWVPDLKNSDGYTLLHVACNISSCSAVEVLLSGLQCSPNLTSNDGKLPLDLTSENKIIQLLIEHNALISSDAIVSWMNEEEFDSIKSTFTKLLTFSNWRTTDGDSLLHLMCRLTYQNEESYGFMDYLMEGDNNMVKSANNDGKLPIHLTYNFTIIEHVLNYGGFIDSDVVFKIMMYHFKPESAAHGDESKDSEDRIISLLKTSLDQNICKWIPNDLSSNGNTALHIACETNRVDLVHYLLSDVKCNANVENSEQNVPIQLASNLDIIEELIQYGAVTTSDVVLKFLSLHALADLNKSFELLKLAIKNTTWNPNDKTEDGETALHLAVRLHNKQGTGNVQSLQSTIVHFLLSECKCNPNIADKHGWTTIESLKNPDIIEDLILHGATTDTKFVFNMISLLSEDVAIKLLTISNKNTTWRCADVNEDGDTALHIACKIKKPKIVSFLLDEAQCDPNMQNSSDKSPLEVTSDTNIILDLIRHGAKITAMNKIQHQSLGTDKPLQTPVKIFIIGNPDAGKSTLTEALKTELSFVSRFFRSSLISNVDAKTAGVIPHEFNSKYYGRVTLYDFAGHREFHSSHAALLQNAIELSSPIFLLVVNLFDSVKTIEQNIHYWLSFLDNQCSLVSGKPHVIIVGSHADKLEKGVDANERVTCIESLSTSKLHIAGFVSMNCQYAQSSGMTELHKLLSTS